MQIINKFKELTRREKILFGILSFLILELLIYTFFVSHFIKRLNSIKFKNQELQSQINLKNQTYEKALAMQDDNKKLLNSNSNSSFNILNEENIKEFAGNDIVVLQADPDREAIDFKINDENLETLKRFNKFFIFDSMEISKEVEDEYLFKANLTLNKNSNLPKIVASGEKVNLKENYYKNKQEDKKQEEKNKIERSKEIGKISAEIKNTQTKRNLGSNKSKKVELKDDIKVNLDNEQVKNLENVEVYKSDSLIPDFKFLDFDINKFVTYAEPGNEISLINLEDMLVVDYDVKKESDDKHLLILFNDIVDVKNFKLLLELPYNFSGEIGYLDTYRNPFDLSMDLTKDQLIEIDEIKNLKGLYYKADTEEEKGYFIIKFIEAEI